MSVHPFPSAAPTVPDSSPRPSLAEAYQRWGAKPQESLERLSITAILALTLGMMAGDETAFNQKSTIAPHLYAARDAALKEFQNAVAH